MRKWQSLALPSYVGRGHPSISCPHPVKFQPPVQNYNPGYVPAWLRPWMAL